MGMYDEIVIPCPACGKEEQVQSKSGPCEGRVYSLGEAPQVVLIDANRHAPFVCERCEILFRVRIGASTEEWNPDRHSRAEKTEVELAVDTLIEEKVSGDW